MMFLEEKKQIKQKLYVYTDGSYRDGIYSGAFLAYKGTKCIFKDSGIGTKAASMNNVAGELSAVMRAAVWLGRSGYRGVIVYDYKGIENWLDGSWRCKNEYTQQYRDFMTKYVKDGTVEFKWVRGHDGDLGNEQADKLAKEALNKRMRWKVS